MTRTLEEALEYTMGAADAIVFQTVGFRDEDLAQEVRVAIWLAARSWRPELDRTPQSWMGYKARWRAIDAYRSRTGDRRRTVRTTICTTDGLPEHLLGQQDDHADAVCERQDVHRIVSAALDRLPPRDRRIVAGWLTGTSQTELAAACHLTAGRVSQIIKQFTTQSAHRLHDAA